MAAGNIVNGMTVTWDTNVFVITDLNSFSWSGIQRTMVNTSTISTVGGMTFVASKKYDPGEVSFDAQYDPTRDPDFSTDAATTAALTFNWPDAGSNSSSCVAVMNGFEIGGNDEEVITCRPSFKLTGDVTW